MSRHHDSYRPHKDRLRAAWALRLPLPCSVCSGIIEPGQAFWVEHLTPLSQGGDPLDPGNQGVSHPACQRREGGRLGAAVTNRTYARLRKWPNAPIL